MGTNLKFFSQNEIDVNSTFTFTSASETLAAHLYDNDYSTQLISSGSDDVTPEIYIIDLPTAKDFDALFIGNHNFKNFTVQTSTDNGVSYGAAIVTETTNTDSYNFYESLGETDVTNIKVTANTTQTVDAEKLIGQLRVFSLLGEVSANPYRIDPPYTENSFIHPLSNGGNVYVQFGRKINLMLDFDDATTADVTIFRTLKDRFAPFYVYPNGGDTGYTAEPFRVQDMYLVNYVNEYRPYPRRGYLPEVGTEISLQLREV